MRHGPGAYRRAAFWGAKKRFHLIERELASLLQSGAEVAKIRDAAEEVRAAQVPSQGDPAHPQVNHH